MFYFNGYRAYITLKNTYTKLQVNSGKEAVVKALKYRIVKEN